MATSWWVAGYALQALFWLWLARWGGAAWVHGWRAAVFVHWLAWRWDEALPRSPTRVRLRRRPVRTPSRPSRVADRAWRRRFGARG